MPLRFIVSFVPMLFCYGIFLMLYELQFFRQTISAVHPVLIGWAAVVAAYSLLIRLDWQKVFGWKLLAAFCVGAVITVALNMGTGIASNAKVYVMVVLPLVAFLPGAAASSSEKRKRNFFLALSGAALLLFCASAVSLWMYLVRFGAEVTVFGVKAFVGIEPYLEAVILQGVFHDTNHAATYALCFSLFSVFLISECRRGLCPKAWQNKALEIFGIINIIVLLSYFPLANSRGGWLSLFVGLAVAVFLYVLAGRGSGKATPGKIPVALAACVFAIILAWAALRGVRTVWATVSYRIALAAEDEVHDQTDPPTKTEAATGTEALPPASEETTAATAETQARPPAADGVTLNVSATTREDGYPGLTWEKVADAKEYIVYRSADPDGGYEQMFKTAGRTYMNTSAKPGRTYYYKVEAIFADGSSIVSGPVENRFVGEAQKLDRFDKGNSFSGAGRFSLWKEALELYKQVPIFGSNYINNTSYAAEHIPDGKIAQGKALHNSYLDLLVGYGAVGFVLMMSFFVLALVKIVKFMLAGKMKGIGNYTAVCAAVIIAGSSFFLSCVFVNTTAMAWLLFLTVGYLLAEVDR